MTGQLLLIIKIILILIITVVLAGAGTYAIKGCLANKLGRTTSIVEAAVYLFLVFIGFAIVIGTALLFFFSKI